MAESVNHRRAIRAFLAISVLCLFAAGLWFGPKCVRWVLYNSEAEKSAHAEIRQLYEALEPGDSLDAVNAAYARLKPAHVEMGGDNPQECVVFSTPANFAADNWLLHVLLADGKAETIAIRILDTMKEVPFDAPPDKISPTRPTEHAFSAPYIYHPFWGYSARQQP
jgi:hypothetical protein